MLDRLSMADAIELYACADLHDLGRRAHEAAVRLHPEPYRTYVIDRNINYSNLCTGGCTFCNFKVSPGSAGGYVLPLGTILEKVAELDAIGGTQVLMQGGLHPTLPLEWYVELLRAIKRAFPRIHLHAFGPPEIVHLGRLSGLSVAQVLGRLHEAGLDSLPGGGAEILVDRVRRQISPGKCSSDEWIDVMRQCHRAGMATSATMMFGHVETDAERIEHLSRIRELQDETGGFVAFICWTFQHTGTPLWRQGSALRLAGAVEYLRMLAMARLFLDNVPNVQASWVTQGAKIGQLSLFYGANDMGGVMMEENVVSSAGATHRMDECGIRHLIEAAGWQARQRNQRYELVARRSDD